MKFEDFNINAFLSFFGGIFAAILISIIIGEKPLEIYSAFKGQISLILIVIIIFLFFYLIMVLMFFPEKIRQLFKK